MLKHKAKSFTSLSAVDVEKFFKLAERKATYHFAQAYNDDYFEK